MENVTFEFVLRHWAFFVVSLALGTLGEIFKKAVLGDTTVAATGWRYWFQLTLPAHAPVVGFLLGLLFPRLPCPEPFCTDGGLLKALYYLAAGMFSSYVYDFVQHIARLRNKRQ